MKKSSNIDMTVGKPFKLITLFTLPALASNLLNQVYTITDSIIVGRYLGQTSLAAVGVCMPVILLVSAMVIGLNIGVGILMSYGFGSKDYKTIRHTFANAIYMGLFLGVVIAIFGVIITEPILKLMGTPVGPFKEAASYMRITFIATIFPIYYFMFTNVFRGIGDGYTSLYCLIVSVISNIILDFIFVAILNLGVAGSAYATALAQCMSVIFAVIMLYIKYPEMRMKKEDLPLDIKLFKRVSGLAIPIAIQSGFNNLGNVVVQSCINGFGEIVMAAYTVSSRLSNIALIPMETVGSSLSIYAGQNVGAKKLDRIDDGVKASHKLNLIVSSVLALLLVLFGRSFTLLFLPDASEQILNVSRNFLLFTSIPGFLYGVMFVYQYVLRGVGKTRESMIGSFYQLGAKVLVALIGTYLITNLNIVWLAWPISYIAGTIYPYICYKNYLSNEINYLDDELD